MEKNTIKEFEEILVRDKVAITELFLNASYYYPFDKEELCELAGEVFYQQHIMNVNNIKLDRDEGNLKELVFYSLWERWEEEQEN